MASSASSRPAKAYVADADKISPRHVPRIVPDSCQSLLIPNHPAPFRSSFQQLPYITIDIYLFRTLYCNSIYVSFGIAVPVPTEFAPDGQFTAVSSGANAACGVRTDGDAVCWGYLNHVSYRDSLSQGAFSLPAGVQVALPPPWDTDEIAAAEVEMARLVNELRRNLNLAPLTVHTRQSTKHTSLWTVARAWSLTMRDWDIVEHNPDYARQYPTLPVHWTSAGENIAFNSASARTIMDAVQVAFDGLVASPGHYANMTNPEFNHLGVGIAAKGSSFWFTQNFAHYPSAPPAVSMASHTRSGRTGMSMLRTPRWASASTTAFTKAAGEPTVADSPMPLAPIG
jgi:uncharacterized protein YkwD